MFLKGKSIGIGISIGDTGPVFTWCRINTKMFSIAHPLSEVPAAKAALFWKRGRGTAAHLHLKRHAQKQHVSAFPLKKKAFFK